MKIEDIATINDNGDATMHGQFKELCMRGDIQLIKDLGTVIASHKGSITLENWVEVSNEELGCLVQHKGGRLAFVDTEGMYDLQLSAKSAEILSKYAGELSIDTKRLNFVRNSNSLNPARRGVLNNHYIFGYWGDYNKPAEITLSSKEKTEELEIAKYLSNHKSGDLVLPNLQEISYEAAALLLKHLEPVYVDDDLSTSKLNEDNEELISDDISRLILEADERWS